MRTSDKDIDRIYISSATRSVAYRMIENHSHYYHEIYYLKHGKCKLYIDGALYSLEDGDLIIIPPMTKHFVNYITKCTRINLYFKDSDLRDHTGSLFSPVVKKIINQLALLSIPHTYIKKINTIFDTMLLEEKVDDTSTSLLQKLSLQQLLLYLERYGISHSYPGVHRSDLAIMNAIQFINENYASPITLERIAQIAQLSPTYFSKKFRNVTGTGMKEYLNYVRLNHAAMELQSTQNSITDIALNCGFSNSNYFKDSFKKMYQMSPRAYRKSRNNDNVKEETERIQLQNNCTS